MKLFLAVFFIILSFSLSSAVIAQDSGQYQPLAPLPGLESVSSDQGLGEYIQVIFNLSIGLGAVLAVLMLVVGGFQYLSTDQFGTKSDAKDRIQNALMGLGLLLVSVIGLQTINPELLNLELDLETARSEAEVPAVTSIFLTPEASRDYAVQAGVLSGSTASAEALLRYVQVFKNYTQDTVSPELIVAVLDKESGLGKNIGTCRYNRKHNGQVVMKPGRDPAPFVKVMNGLGRNPNSAPVSCPAGASAYGGAMGPGQILPSTWEVEVRKRVAEFLKLPDSTKADPYNIQHAAIGTGIYLQRNYARCRGSRFEKESCAAASYFAGFGGRNKASAKEYARSVMGKKARILQGG